MQRLAGIVISSAIGLGVIVLPILTSVHVARKQVVENEFTLLRDYAHESLRRADGVGDQSISAFRRLCQASLPPCSAAEIDLMRQIAITSSYLMAVGRIRNNQLICTSLGTDRPIPLGPVSYVSKTGEILHLNLRPPFSGASHLAFSS
jgi:sensor c-di-GMP phosphodiesterase-like protein